MCPPLSPELAARFYEAMLFDVLESTARAVRRLDLDAVLAIDPWPRAGDAFLGEIPACFRVVAQRGGDLGARMSQAFAEGAATGARAILLRGSDGPALDDTVIERAHAALARADLVLVPDLDGGYGLVGLRRFEATLFEHAMSTAHVLDDTLAGARRLGLRAEQLAPCFDLDVIDDLAQLASVRAHDPAHACRRTLAFADLHDLWSLARTR